MWPRAAVGRLSSAVPVPLGAFSPGLRSLGGGAPGCSVCQPCGTEAGALLRGGGRGAGLGGHRWENGPGLLAPAQQLVFSKHLLYTAARLDSATSKTWNPDFPSQKGPRLLSRSGCLCRDEWLSWHMGRW